MNKITKQFLNQGPFSFEELYQTFRHENQKKTLYNYLYAGLKKGYIKAIKRGLYQVVFPMDEASNLTPDPFLVASKLAKDSVLAFHSALELHGAAYAHSQRVYFYSKTQTRRLELMGVEYVPVQKKITWGVTTIEREGHTIKLTDRERTVLDCIDVTDYAGGLEELIKSLDLFPSVDFKKVKSYLRKSNKVILYSKAGFLFEHFKNRWQVPENFLSKIEKKVAGKEARYFCTQKGNGKFVSRWNLIVPDNFGALSQAD